MLQLAREAALAGLRVLVTVTTKMFPPDENEFGPAVFDVENLGTRRLLVLAAALDEATHKLLGIDPNRLPGGFDLTLIEADGAAGRPLTAPRRHEPVIPASSTTVLAVAGLDALGQPIAAMHRSEEIALLCGVPIEFEVTPEIVATVLSAPEGNTRGRPPSARTLFVLNKADDPARIAAGLQIAELLRAPALLTSFGHVV